MKYNTLFYLNSIRQSGVLVFERVFFSFAFFIISFFTIRFLSISSFIWITLPLFTTLKNKILLDSKIREKKSWIFCVLIHLDDVFFFLISITILAYSYRCTFLRMHLTTIIIVAYCIILTSTCFPFYRHSRVHKLNNKEKRIKIRHWFIHAMRFNVGQKYREKFLHRTICNIICVSYLCVMNQLHRLIQASLLELLAWTVFVVVWLKFVFGTFGLAWLHN